MIIIRMNKSISRIGKNMLQAFVSFVVCKIDSIDVTVLAEPSKLLSEAIFSCKWIVILDEIPQAVRLP